MLQIATVPVRKAFVDEWNSWQTFLRSSATLHIWHFDASEMNIYSVQREINLAIFQLVMIFLWAKYFKAVDRM